MRAYSWVVSIVCGALAMLFVAARPFAGVSLPGIWQVRAAEAAQRWFNEGGSELKRAAFGDENLFPLPGILAALLSGEGDVMPGLRWLAAVAVGLLVFATAEAARRIAGSVAAVAASLFVLSIPRVLGAADDVGPTIYAVATTTLMVVTLPRVREHGLWLLIAVPATAAALLSSLFAWWMLLIAAVFLFSTDQRGAGSGHVRVAPASLAMLAAIPLAIGLMIAVDPWLHDNPLERLGKTIERWLRQPPEPWLFAGELYGPRRIVWYAPLVTWGITTPLAILMSSATLGLVVRDFRNAGSDSIRGPVIALIWAWAGIVVLRSPYHGAIDLLAFGAPYLAILAAAGVAAAASGAFAGFVPRKAVAFAATIALVAACQLEVYRSSVAPRAFYNVLIGGTAGAVDAGFARYAHPAFPIALFDDLSGREGQAPRVAILANAWELAPVLGWYAERGWIQPAPEIVGLADADWVIASLDDTLPERFSFAVDYARATNPPDSRARILRVDGVDLIAILPAR